MGCAFSHTEQIFIIDHRNNNTLRKAKTKSNGGARFSGIGGMGILGHVRQALAHSPQVHVTAHWLLASSKSENDIVLVGHLKSNGLHRRQRRSSSAVRFIEHRPKTRMPSVEEPKDAWEAKMPKSPSMASFYKLRKVSKSQERHITSNNHYGLIDFRKRLERVRKVERTEGDEGMPKMGEEQAANNERNANFGQMELAPKKAALQQQQEPIEAMIIKHRIMADEEEAGTGMEDDQQVFCCDWDTVSSAADCCSIQMAPFHCRTSADGCSEASFVLVKKRLKVAWEHHQIVQVRRHSLCRRADTPNGTVNNGIGILANNNNNSPLKNTWMPDIAQEEAN
ncbi:hypothetical protein niasHT_013860 [Heterodera trifolii]|uniref:Uncharacterized protein n=1 Tax=Heterodera trifolii TaxID=157864 RepID=A0ABD2LFC8_9BILA